MPHNFSRYVVVLLLLSAVSGRDLRPADHGLTYQQDTLPPAQNADGQEMQSFFGSTTRSIPLPEAQNINATWWSVNGNGEVKSRDGGRDHVRMGLLVASAVCGLTGVVLLIVSGIIFLFRLHNKRTNGAKAENISSTSASATATVNYVPRAVTDAK